LAFRVFAFLMASFLVGYAVLLWRDSSWLYRDPLSRRTFGWANGTKWERPIALVGAGLAILVAGAAILLALTVP
jgi:uncharacterized membrane protein YphA (DoxX/SURF4 family)